MKSIIENLIEDSEKLYLEFKKKWYWDKGKGTNKEWGEFLKDFVALVNCSREYVGESKYLIIGVDESKNNINERLVDVYLPENLSDTSDLKKIIISKIDIFFRYKNNIDYHYDNFEVKFYKFNNKKILVFEIKPTKSLLTLKKDLQCKNRTVKENIVFVRSLKKGNEPEIINASMEIGEELSNAIELYAKTIEREEGITKSIEKTIGLFVHKNEMLSMGSPIKKKIWKIKDKNVNIFFEFYPIKSEFINIDFIYLYSRSNLTQTYKYLIKEHIILSDDIKNRNKRFILIDSEQNRNLNGIRIKFKTNNVYTLEKFALEYLYKDYLDDSIYHNGTFGKQIPNFIKPFTKNSEEKDAFLILLEWFDEKSKPLMIVTGYGGVGKTTLVKYFLDSLYQNNKIKILFISSKEIINEISKKGSINNVYDFYEALAKKRKLKKVFHRELLELTIDNGNLLLVLDGIDEVIAKLGTKFDVNEFVETIYKNYSIGNQKTKIIITCRDYFWDENSIKKYEIDTIELKAFNLKLAKELFEKEFKNSQSVIKKCLELANKFALNVNEENLYIPYILDLIIDMVKQKKELGEVNYKDIETNILFNELTNDYFIGSICNREIIKLNNLNVDKQLMIFMEMAVNFNGNIHQKSINSLFNNDEIGNPSNELIQKFKGHPLLNYAKINEVLSFRYDFFNEFFIGLKISDFFKRKKMSEFNKVIKTIIVKNIFYENSFTELVCKRFKINEELKIFIMELIENLISEIEKGENKLLNRELISALIVILLTTFNQSSSKVDTETRTLLLEEIFGDNFNYLTLINVYGKINSKHYPIFDFRNKIINNAMFDNYPYFWECKIDDKTQFRNSIFKNLKPRNGVTPKSHEDLFIDCNTGDINEILNKQKNINILINQKKKDKILRIFKIFEEGGNFKEQKTEKVRSKCDTNILDILIKNKVITPYKNPQKPKLKQYKISNDYFNILKVIHQNGTCVELEKILKML